MTELVECFNAKITEFARDLSGLFPSDPDIAAVKSGLSMSMVVDEAKPARLFHKFVAVPHGDRLLARDEEFFLTANEADVVRDGTVSGAVAMIARLRDYWAGMSAGDRAVVWNYFKLLVMLSRKIHE